MGSSRTELFALLLAVAAPLVALPASAQEAPPVPLSIAFAPEDHEPIVMRVRDAGFVVKAQDGGWRLMCASALAVSGNSNFFIDGVPGGGLLVTHYNGVQKGDAALCDWRFPDAALEDRHVVTATRQGDRIDVLSTADNRYTIHRSTDGGESFALIAELPEPLAYLSLEAAPSDPDRLYLTAVDFDFDSGVTTRYLYRTDDGGESFTQHDLELGQQSGARLAGVDPDDPDRVYLAFAQPVSSHSHGDEEHVVDELLVSADGGESWTRLQEIGLFGGLGIGPAAGELWLADADGGLLRSTDRGASFEALDIDIRASCVHVRGDRVWICGDSARGDAFSIGYTEDQGGSFTGVMRFDEVEGLLQCGGVAISGCDAAWAGWMFWHNIDAGVPDPVGHEDAGPSARMDASVDDGGRQEPSPSLDAQDEGGDGDDGGCDCRVSGAGDLGASAPLLLALLALVRRRRR